MARFKMTAITLLSLAGALVAGSAASAASARDNQWGFQQQWGNPGAIQDQFIERPLRVFIEFDSLRDLRREQNIRSRKERRRLNRQDRFQVDRMEVDVLNLVSRQVSSPIQLLSRPRTADLVIRAQPIGANLRFDIVDVDPKVKRNGKRFSRRTYTYDRVEEIARIRYTYAYTIRLPNGQRVQRQLNSQVADRFVYATNIQGFGRVAFEDDLITHRRVNALASRNSPQFRSQIVRGLKQQAAAQVAFEIARIIDQQTHVDFQPVQIWRGGR